MRLTLDIPDQFILDQLAGAAISYWCERCKWSTNLTSGWVIELEPDKGDEGKKHKLDFKRAIRLAVRQYPRILNEDLMDAETGDMWVQLAAFGEIKYG